MVGTLGERMMRLAAEHADAWNAWFTWYGNGLDGLHELLAKVDAACGQVGREPATLERTVAVLVQVETGEVAVRGGRQRKVAAIPSEGLTETLHAYAGAGIAHVQLVVDPITVRSIEKLGEVLAELDGR